jgi:glycosyltransferase involved in cell wall biosynthesis
MLVSVILNSYNRPRRVREAIRSIQAQTYTNWELIVVDDNSNEQTQEVLKEIETRDKRIKIIQTNVKPEDRHKTARYATCINLAIPLLKGELVTYLTDDDIYYPHRFESMVPYFQNQDIFVVYGKQNVIHEDGEGNILKSYTRGQVGVTKAPAGFIDHNSIMHRVSCFQLTGLWDDQPIYWWAGDASFFSILSNHWSFYPVPMITDEHRWHGKGIQDKMMRGESPWVNPITE